MKLFKATLTVGILTMASRVIGLVRDILTASFLGAGLVADAFFVALRLPNFFRRVTAEGAFSVSFIPIYARTSTQEGDKEAAQFAGDACGWMALVLAPVTILFMVFMPYVIHVIAPGFGEDSQRFDMAVEMSRISFPYLIFISLTALIGGVLNAHDRFGPFAAAPILFNLCLVLALVFGTKIAPSAGHAMAWGVSISGVLQLALMFWFMRRYKIAITFRWPKITTKIKELGRLIGPGALGAGVVQINLLVDMVIASFFAAGAISHLYYADRLNQLPLGVVGAAIATTLLPMLSKAVASKDPDEAKALFSRALEFCFFLSLPAATALLVIPVPILSVLFERGEFTHADTVITAGVLMGYAIGLPAYVSMKVLASASWAKHDTATPVKIAIISTILNIILAVGLSRIFGVAGIALGTGIVGWIQFYLMWNALRGDSSASLDERAKRSMPLMLLASAIMGALLLGGVVGLHDQLYGESEISRLLALAGIIGVGGLTYFALVFAFGIVKYSEVKDFLRRKKPDIKDQPTAPDIV